jgi:hypothetical protein
VPTLTSEEVDSWISHFEFVQEPRRRGSSWDLWQTDNENYVLFPSDDDHPHALNVCAVVVTGSTVQLRTFVSGLAISRDEVIATAAPHIATQTCVYTDKVDDPGAPYRGSCVSDDDACPDGCSAQIALSPTTGRYSITDCKCEK